MTYPPNWPRCPVCGDFALDGHITCGRWECNESEQRRLKNTRKSAPLRTPHDWEASDNER